MNSGEWTPPPELVRAVVGALRDRGGKGAKEIAFRCPAHDDKTPSATFNTDRAVWACHAGGCGKSGGVKELAELLGIDPHAYGTPRPPSSRIALVRAAPAAAMPWTPSTAPPPDLIHPQRGKPAVAWEIRNARGELFAIHARWPKPDGEGKDFAWWRGGRWSLDGAPAAAAPLYGSELLGDVPPGEVVVVTEGEKAADALRGIGLVAVGSVTGAASTPDAEALDVLRGRRVVLFPDADAAGRAHMERIAQALRGVAASVAMFTPAGLPEGGDAVEWIAARPSTWGDAELREKIIREAEAAALAPAPPPREKNSTGWMLAGVTPLADLLARKLPDPEPLVEGLLYEGAAILSGPPKVGKSALARCAAYSVVKGVPFLGGGVPRPGAVLYLSLEDGPRRTGKRFLDLLRGEPAPAGLLLATEWGRQDEGGIDAIEEWITATPGARLVILDTLAAFRQRPKGNAKNVDRYTFDYDTLAAVQALATRHHVSLLVIHHNRKQQADDPMELVSGTAGVTGAVDAALVLRRPRAENVAELAVMSRDTEDRTLAVQYDGASGWWTLPEGGREALLTPERRKILDYLRELRGESAWPKEIADGTGLPSGSVKHLIGRLLDAELVERTNRGYRYTGTTARL